MNVKLEDVEAIIRDYGKRFWTVNTSELLIQEIEERVKPVSENKVNVLTGNS